ncbi:MAG TPA: response regulator [Candidatus Pelethocola excrementipullorum]|nr:response regulator [Candidatus Pelethocola excrementipullorum]
MLKVLIVDDEKKVGELIKALIEWKRLELSLVDVVLDGKKAYEVILEEKPDIVITDIRMPNLSGLELIKHVMERDLDVRFIVISGYRYFEYAQTALRYGVEDYLLKPIDEIELNKILDKVCREKRQKQMDESHTKSLQKKYRESKHILHRELMDRIMFGSEEQKVEEINQEYGVDLGEGIFRALGVKVDRNTLQEKNKQQEKLILRKLSDMISEEFEQKVSDLVISIKNSMTILVLLNYEEDRRFEVAEGMRNLFQRMKDYINDFENYEITMGLSGETAEFSQVNIPLEMVKEALNCRIFEGVGRCIETISGNRNPSVKAMDVLREYEEAFIKYIHIADKDGMGSIVKSCFRMCREKSVMACEYYEVARRLFGEYCEELSELYHEDMKHIYNEWLEESGHYRTVSSLAQYVRISLENHMSSVTKRRKEQERRPILEAIEYIKKNYGQKILLEEVAERSGFNANYFSELFKNETGKNFSTYLLEVRMAEAKLLLRDTSDTIYEITAKVGYKDSKFFSQQFTKTVGIKPTEYRKLYY